MSLTNVDERTEDRDNANCVTALPSGVLSVHVKTLKLEDSHFVVPDPDVYVRVRVGPVTKSTRIFTPQRGRDTVIDDVKNFALTLSTDRSLPQNEVRIDLIMIVTAHVHRILGHKDMHVYDVLKNLYAAGTYDLRFRHEHVAYVDAELCFAYGIFGYGYSHELENRQAKTEDIVSRSFLYRADPPAERKQSNSLVMASVHLDHPEFINFAEKVKIGPAFYQEHDTGVPKLNPFEHLEPVKPVLLTKKMQKRLDRIQSDYAQLNTRAQRKKFLEKLILRKVEDHHTEPGQADLPSEGQDPTGGPSKGQAPPLSTGDFMTVAPQTGEEYEEEDMNVIDMASIIANAPGIITRGATTDRRRRPNLPPDIEDDSDGSQSSLSGPTGSGLNSVARDMSDDSFDGSGEVIPSPDRQPTSRSSRFYQLTTRFLSRWRASRPSVAPDKDLAEGLEEEEDDLTSREQSIRRTQSIRRRQRSSVVTEPDHETEELEDIGQRDIA